MSNIIHAKKPPVGTFKKYHKKERTKLTVNVWTVWRLFLLFSLTLYISADAAETTCNKFCLRLDILISPSHS